MIAFVQIPVLVRRNGILEPNLHSSVVSMIEEAKWMAQLGVKVPPEANSITMVTIKKHHDQIKVAHEYFLLITSTDSCAWYQFLLDEEARMWKAVPAVFTSVMKYHIRKVETVLSAYILSVLCAL